MGRVRSRVLAVAVPLFLAMSLSAGVAAGQQVPAPVDYLGFAPGTDSALADWQQISGYLEVLASHSPLVRLDTIGVTVMGRALLLLEITSAANHLRRDEIRRTQRLLAYPDEMDSPTEAEAAEHQPAVILINNNLHATEIASSLFGLELAHRLADRDDYRSLLDSVVVLMIPSANPDGLDTAVGWYREYRGTEFENGPLPWIHHPYAHHEINRDWFMLTQPETRAISAVLYRDWFPQVVWDVHQMEQVGPRFFVPPFAPPTNPNLDPLLVAAIDEVGGAMSSALQDSGFAGVVSGERFDLWWHGGFRSVPTRHNMIGILSEAASARLASPVFIDPVSLDRFARINGLSHRRPGGAAALTEPWPGGFWSIGDIVRYELAAADALLNHVASARRLFVTRFVDLGRRAVAMGRESRPFAFVIPNGQRDPQAAEELQRVLLATGIRLVMTTAEFRAGGSTFSQGAVVIPMAQPFRAHAKDLLEVQRYPDEPTAPSRSYDSAGWTLPLQMGVEVVTVQDAFEYEGVAMEEPSPHAAGRVLGSGTHIVMANRSTAETQALVAALKTGATAWTTQRDVVLAGDTLRRGSIVLHGGAADSVVTEFATTGGFRAYRTDQLSTPARVQVGMPAIAVYQSWTGNADEGWTRWLLETFGVPYASLTPRDVSSGMLAEGFDVMVIPSEQAALLSGAMSPRLPPEFSGGLGTDQVNLIRDFIERGGVVVALGAASAFAIDAFQLPISDAGEPPDPTKGSRFSTSGSIFGVIVERNSAISSGLPDSLAVFSHDGRAFEVHGDAEVIARFAEQPLLSGRAGNDERMAGGAALVVKPVGRGKVILFAFRPQHRGQTHGTFKALFNALLLGGL